MNQIDIPFTYLNIFNSLLSESKTVLDVGCGHGKFMKQLNSEKQFEATGVEIFDEYITQAKNTDAYIDVVKQDIRKLDFPNMSFDAVMLSQVIEHLTKEEGLEIMRRAEKIAEKVVIIATPNGSFDQGEYDGNKFQEHHSSWLTQDFQKLGYTVYGQGANFIYKDDGLYHKWAGDNNLKKTILFGISFLLSPLVFFVPKLGAQLIAVKKI
jgi:2-polyprenyl-3-methyl-5-hydroxy-6-metoxy-1,4-benzoquinol methylase